LRRLRISVKTWDKPWIICSPYLSGICCRQSAF
jgi:hypothetical protein